MGLLLNATPVSAMEDDAEKEHRSFHSVRREVRDPEERRIIRSPSDPERLKRQGDALPRENQKTTGAISLSQLMSFEDNY